jgi:hypothetical protein
MAFIKKYAAIITIAIALIGLALQFLSYRRSVEK